MDALRAPRLYPLCGENRRPSSSETAPAGLRRITGESVSSFAALW
jgi:hypothetical protein